MCVSSCGQIVFGIIMFVCLVLTLVAIFTPGWRKFSDEVRSDIKNMSVPENQGLLPFLCRLPGDDKNAKGTDYCDNWWKNAKTWEKAVIACMCIAACAEVLVLVWNCIAFCACCCKKCLIQPLSIISYIIVILLAAAVIVYGVNNKSAFEDIDQWKDVEGKMKSEVGYSFWCAVFALVTAAAAAIVATVTVCVGEKGC